MEHHHDDIPTKNFALKVDINHCNNCVEKAMKKMKKMDGIDSAKYDTAKEMLRVSGNIEPAMLIQKFDKWGRKAELYSFEKEKCKTCCSSKNKTHGIQIKKCDSSSDSSDVEDKESYDIHAPKKGSNSIRWQHQSLMKSPPKEEIPMKKQSEKKSKKLFGSWFRKKDKAPKISSNKNVSGKSWHFPRPAYGVPGLFGDQRPYHMNQYPPMMFLRPMRPYYGYGWMPPPVIPPQPLPYGFFQPRMNPMIHYTSYRDNYYP